jgi:hypothetical protein
MPPTVGQYAQEDDSLREGGGTGMTAWLRPVGGGHHLM